MQNLLRQHIENTLHKKVTDDQFDQLWDLFFSKSYEKKAFLTEEGKTNKYIFFIEQGSCYSFIVDQKGEKHAIQFALEGYWISDLYSFFSDRPSIYNIETLEPTNVLVLSKDNFQKANDICPLFDRFFRILVQNAYVSLQYRLAKTNSEEAAHRYLEFSQLHPDFVQRIPQYLIASYLGIKPQSLSRIRKEIAKRK